MNVLIVKYGEVAMRGNNRKVFIKGLAKAVERAISEFGNFYIMREQGRLIVKSYGGDLSCAAGKIALIPGILGVSHGILVQDQELDSLKDEAVKFLADKLSDGKARTFKVKTKRSDKRYPITSNEVSAEIGGYVLEKYPFLKAEMRTPELSLYVELRNQAYIYTDEIKGIGGLPPGSSGKGLALMSGGIDSPVAAWEMIKRGVYLEGVYFDTPPYTSARAKQKVADLAGRLADYLGEFTLYTVPFTEVSLYLHENVPHDKLTIFLKRAMLRTAEMIAEKNKLLALVTGDSVGQVASQTIEALYACNSAVKLPILRPLCGMDKQEIVDIANKIGTFEISSRPYEDCCTVFVAKHPETKPKASVIESIEEGLSGLLPLIEKAAASAEKEMA